MSWRHLSDATPVARKSYQCCLCGLLIDIGTFHIKRTGTESGELVSFRMHVACEALTGGWTIDDWECHDPSEFRRYELGEATQP